MRGSITGQNITAEVEVMPDGTVRLSLIHPNGSAITAMFESEDATAGEHWHRPAEHWQAAPAA